MLGIGIAIASALAVALIVRADQRSHDADTPIFRALGCSVPQLGASAAIRMLPAALGGALLAVGFAVVLSARFPIGIGREIELDPGLDANLAILGLGALLIVILVELCAFAFGRPRRQHAVAPANRRTMARWLGNSGAPTDLTIASHLTFDRGQGVRSVPSRQAIIGGATLLAVLTAVGVYVSGVDHLYAVPAAHGWPWDAAIGNINFPLSQDTADRIDRDPRIAAHTSAHYGSAKVNGQLSEFLAFDPQGDAPPDVVTGRLPRTAHEVALGDATMRDLGLHLGSTVKLSIAGSEFDAGDPTTPLKLKVVGVALAPEFGDMDVGKVGLVPLDAIAAAGGLDGPQLELVKVSPGHRATTIAALDRSYTEEMATNLVPAQVVNLHRVRSLALLGFVAAALMGLFVFLYVLVVSARARTHEIAVLRSLGLRARQLRRILAWQGSLLAAGMTLIGIPLGILLGAALWGRVARSLGMHHTIEVNPRLLILVPLVFLFAVVASLYTARRTLARPDQPPASHRVTRGRSCETHPMTGWSRAIPASFTDPAATLDPETATLPAVFASVVTAHGTRVAIEDATGATTFAELADRSRSLATALVSDNHDASPGADRRGTRCTRDHRDPRRGASGSPVRRSSTSPLPTTIAVLVAKQLDARVVIIDREHRAQGLALGPNRRMIDLDELPTGGEGRAHGTRAAPDDPLSISFTSGSSGIPKAVVHSHRNVVVNGLRFAAANGMDTEDRVLVSLPLQFTASATSVYSALLTGATGLYCDLASGGLDVLAQFVQDTTPTVVQLAPAQILPLTRHLHRVGHGAVRPARERRWRPPRGVRRRRGVHHLPRGACALPVQHFRNELGRRPDRATRHRLRARAIARRLGGAVGQCPRRRRMRSRRVPGIAGRALGERRASRPGLLG